MNGTREDRIEVIRILVFVEAAIAAVMAVEALGAVAFGGPAGIPLVIVSVLTAAGTLWLVRGIRLRSRKNSLSKVPHSSARTPPQISGR